MRDHNKISKSDNFNNDLDNVKAEQAGELIRGRRDTVADLYPWQCSR
jgi:hypothetical protein